MQMRLAFMMTIQLLFANVSGLFLLSVDVFILLVSFEYLEKNMKQFNHLYACPVQLKYSIFYVMGLSIQCTLKTLLTLLGYDLAK